MRSYVGMFIAQVSNRSSRPAFLLQASYREGGKVKSGTRANVTPWPAEKIEWMRRVLAGDTRLAPSEALVIERSLPHGHVAAVLGTLRPLELDRRIAAKDDRHRQLVLAMIAARILDPRSKLATGARPGRGDGLPHARTDVGHVPRRRRGTLRGDGWIAEAAIGDRRSWRCRSSVRVMGLKSLRLVTPGNA